MELTKEYSENKENYINIETKNQDEFYILNDYDKFFIDYFRKYKLYFDIGTHMDEKKSFLGYIYSKYRGNANFREKFLNVTKELFLKKEAEEYLNYWLEEYITKKEIKDSIFNNLNKISKLKYENHSINGNLLILNFEKYKRNIRFAIEFESPIEINETRLVRKLIEISDRELFLIGDGEKFYGFGKIIDLNNLQGEQEILNVEFIGSNHFSISFLKVEVFKSNESNLKKEIFEFKIENIFLMIVNEEKIIIEPKKYSTEELRRTVKKVIPTINDENIDKVYEIVTKATEQKKGTMLVFSEKASTEAARLVRQSIKIKPQTLKQENVENFTRIDGAILIDDKLECHSLGVILDGIAREDIGESSRGARYNSALRYLKYMDEKCLIIVISEDGMIDILPNINEENENKISEKFKTAMKSLKNNEYDESKKHFLEIIDLDNSNITSYLYCGRIELNRNKYDEALIYFKKALEIDSTNFNATKEIGATFLKKKEIDRAIIYFTEALKIRNNDRSILNYLGIAFAEKKEYKEALKYFEEILTIDPKDSKVMQNIAKTYYAQGEYNIALGYYKQALELENNDDCIICKIADCNKNLNQEEDAIKNYKKVLEKKEDCLYLYKKIGEIYAKNSDFREAIKYFELALKQNPNSIELNFQLGNFYCYNKNTTKAIEYVEKAYNLNNNNPMININYKEILLLNGRTKESLDVEKIDTKDKSYNIVFYILDAIGKVLIEEEFEFDIEYIKKNIKYIYKQNSIFWSVNNIDIWIKSEIKDEIKTLKLKEILDIIVK